MTPDILYFDNAATSCPKPPETLRAMRRFMEDGGGSPGRSGQLESYRA